MIGYIQESKDSITSASPFEVIGRRSMSDQASVKNKLSKDLLL